MFLYPKTKCNYSLAEDTLTRKYVPCTLTVSVSVKHRVLVRNGEDTLTLQVYCPASDTRSGLRERTRELPVPDATLPLGWVHVMVVVVDSVSPPVTVAVQVRVQDWPAVKEPVGDEVVEAPTVSVGTVKRAKQYT